MFKNVGSPLREIEIQYCEKYFFCIFFLVDLDHQIKCNNQSKEEMQFLNNDYIHSGKQDLPESYILVSTHCSVLKKHLGKL